METILKHKHTPNYNIHRTENVTVNVSRYIWNVNVTYQEAVGTIIYRYINDTTSKEIYKY
jgi:hypothetical protein